MVVVIPPIAGGYLTLAQSEALAAKVRAGLTDALEATSYSTPPLHLIQHSPEAVPNKKTHSADDYGLTSRVLSPVCGAAGIVVLTIVHLWFLLLRNLSSVTV